MDGNEFGPAQSLSRLKVHDKIMVIDAGYGPLTDGSFNFPSAAVDGENCIIISNRSISLRYRDDSSVVHTGQASVHSLGRDKAGGWMSSSMRSTGRAASPTAEQTSTTSSLNCATGQDGRSMFRVGNSGGPAARATGSMGISSPQIPSLLREGTCPRILSYSAPLPGTVPGMTTCSSGIFTTSDQNYVMLTSRTPGKTMSIVPGTRSGTVCRSSALKRGICLDEATALTEQTPQAGRRRPRLVQGYAPAGRQGPWPPREVTDNRLPADTQQGEIMKRILIPLACLFVAVASVPALAQEGSTNTKQA